MGGTFKHQLIFALILTIISGSAYAEFEVSDRDIFYGHIRNQADNLFNRADLENSTSGGAAPSEHSYEDIQLDLAELAAVEEELLQMQNVTPEFLSTEEVEASSQNFRPS